VFDIGTSINKYKQKFKTDFEDQETTQSYPITTQYSEKELLILHDLKNTPSITQGELAQSLGMDTNQIKYYLNKLKNGSNPAIRHIGTTRNGYWEVLVEITEK